MQKTLFTLTLILVLMACTTPRPDHNDQIEVLETYSELESLLEEHGEELLVVNFWATSCPPCLKEMPHFNELARRFEGRNVKVLLVSLDRARDLDARVYPFVKRLGIEPEVVLLEDQNYSAWTGEVDPSWYGALPATLIFTGDKKMFRFGAYETFEELQDDVETILAQ